MIPNTSQAKILGWAFESKRKKRPGFSLTLPGRIPQDPFKKPEDADIEILWYQKSKSLCFQPHPEYGLIPCRQLFFSLIDELIG
jgi:hypothetical protein